MLAAISSNSMAVEYVPVAEEEGEDTIEVPTEADGTLPLSTLAAQYPGVSGLRYRNPDTNALRAVRLTDGILYQPPELLSWNHNGNVVYLCTFPKDNKRKGDLESDEHGFKPKKRRCTDLIVLGLPYKVTEEDLKDHFGRFGDVVMSQIKRDQQGGSKGFGFIRFGEFDSQIECLSTPRHQIQGRWCEVKVPLSQGEPLTPMSVPRRVFVGRVTEDLTAPVLKEFFSQYGTVDEVYIPKPFRAFAFVTFGDPGVADKLINEDFVINGISVRVGHANPKQNLMQMQQQQQQQNYPQQHQQMSMMRGGPRMSGPGRGGRGGGGGWQQMGGGGGGGGGAPYQEVVNALASNPQVLAAALAQVSSMGPGNNAVPAGGGNGGGGGGGGGRDGGNFGGFW